MVLNAHLNYEWLVVGAGPAGIAAIGKLIDYQVNPQHIAWVDPSFKVGDFGTKWSEVPGNTKVHLFLNFLKACQAFEYSTCKEKFPLHDFARDETCILDHMVKPLQWVSDNLRKKIIYFQNKVKSLKLEDRIWAVNFENGKKVYSKNVILAVGSKEKKLHHPYLKTISIETALNKDKFNESLSSDDTVALFGSSHSAILILRNLLEHKPQTKVMHFYKKQLCYAVYLDQMDPITKSPVVLFDYTGLKGSTAQWAKENLHGKKHENYERIFASNENLSIYLPKCTHAVYAIGFQRRKVVVEGLSQLTYNHKTGIICPGLFGVGIAFPEVQTNYLGETEYRVGLGTFMDYLNRILPVWVKYGL